MALIHVTKETSIDRFGRVTKHDLLHMKCDVCGKEWSQRGSKTRVRSRKTHVCSKACKGVSHKSGGIVERQRAKTCLERYGAENPFASDICKEKMKETWIKKYGIVHGPSAPSIREKAKKTMIERYGKNPFASKEIQDKIKTTMRQNWGVDYPMQLQHVKDALVSGSIKKFGTAYPMQNKEVQKHALRIRDKFLWMSNLKRNFA